MAKAREHSLLVGYSCSVGAVANIGLGCRDMADSIMQASSLRDAIYSRTTEITPEVVERVSKLVEHSNMEGIHLLIGGLCAGIAYIHLRGSSNPK